MITIREDVFGKASIRLVKTKDGYGGAVFIGGVRKFQTSGADAEDVWRRLRAEVGKVGSDFYGFDGAKARFARIFPGGFRSSDYDGKERAYKISAKEKLEAAAPHEQALSSSGLGEKILSAFRATNLLAPIESTRMQAVLRSPDADRFIRGAARFAAGNIEGGLAEMKSVLAPHKVATWPAVTYLPFLWKPNAHMFLKPEVTKDYAARVGHMFAYEYSSELSAPVYECLLDLTVATEAELAELYPADRIDVQSFIWVVGKYDEPKRE